MPVFPKKKPGVGICFRLSIGRLALDWKICAGAIVELFRFLAQLLFTKTIKMKISVTAPNLKMLLTLVFFSFMQLALLAQDSGSSSSSTSTTTRKVDVSINNDAWYTNPIVWVIGGALFILLLVALLRSGGSSSTTSASDRVTVTKTVERDTDV